MRKFYTIGYGNRDPEGFASLLKRHQVATIVDIRSRAWAYRGDYTRARDPAKGIEGLLTKHGIEYRYLCELGNHFSEYRDWPTRYGKLLDKAGKLLTKELKTIEGPFCLMCTELNVERCHRKILSEYLIGNGYKFAKHL